MIIIIMIGYLVLINFKNSIEEYHTYMNCCEGNVCSDTYYTPEDNKCHLILCEQMPFTKESECIYEGKNIIINSTIAGVNYNEK